jgi:hypothetical protein
MPNSLQVGRSLSELNELSSLLWHSSTLTEGLDEMLAAVMELLGAPMGNIQLLDPEGEALTIAAHHGFDREFLEFFRVVTAADESACGRALRTGERVIIENVETDPLFAPYVDAALVAGYRAVQTTRSSVATASRSARSRRISAFRIGPARRSSTAWTSTCARPWTSSSAAARTRCCARASGASATWPTPRPS